MKKVSTALFIALFSAQAISAVPSLPRDLTKYRQDVLHLGAKLNTIEKEIGSKNDLYLSSIEAIKQFENDLKMYQDRLDKLKDEQHRAEIENQKILMNYIAQEGDDTVEDWQKKAHLQLLQTSQNKWKQKGEEIISFQAKIDEFSLKLEELKKNELELQVVIKELETRKKTAMETYLSKVEKKNELEEKYQQRKLQTKIVAVKKKFSSAPEVTMKAERIFAKPLEDFLSYQSSPKGVTFKYKAVQPVKAVGPGKIVFSGDLASYGQVVMIDHGNDLRSVILGKMSIRVKKNDQVKDGDVLGYTQGLGSEADHLYFEIRKKNTAQNTILWLDLNQVSKI
ncbi:MAG: murein hydrolase activator EnvC family protein [Bacteriovoracaceae bacterium]|jgi:septal ring factor EnvC (AmiA/AmiB activator)